MKEITGNIARFLRKCRKGVISTWYFSVFLFCFTLLGAAADNDIRTMKTLINLKQAEIYLEAECEVIHDIRCYLQNEDVQSGMRRTSSFMYYLEVSDEELTARIIEPSESLHIEIRDGKIFDYTAERDEKPEGF
jgi:hypothetical protein